MSDTIEDLQHDLAQCLEVRQKYLDRIVELEAELKIIGAMVDQRRDYSLIYERIIEALSGDSAHPLS